MGKKQKFTSMNTVQQVYTAAWLWYGKMNIDSCCLAENRLNRGEVPEYKNLNQRDLFNGENPRSI